MDYKVKYYFENEDGGVTFETSIVHAEESTDIKKLQDILLKEKGRQCRVLMYSHK